MFGRKINNMKNLSNIIIEASIESGILDYSYEVFPYIWESFKKIAESKFKLKIHKPTGKKDDIYELVWDPKTKEVLARYDDDKMEVWSSITKSDFFQVGLKTNIEKMKKYI